MPDRYSHRQITLKQTLDDALAKKASPAEHGHFSWGHCSVPRATCEACGHKADVNVNALPEGVGSLRRDAACAAVSAAESGLIRGLHGTRSQFALCPI
jgi:hypothetical protein